MKMTCHLDLADLNEYIRSIFGNSYEFTNVSNMQGGAQKVVYKVDCSNGFSCVLYVWDASKSYFQKELVKQTNVERSYGSDLFEANNKHLTLQGVLTPALYDLNTDRDRYPFDYALVEYVAGHKAEVYLQRSDPQTQDTLLGRVSEMLANMHGEVRDAYGKLNAPLIRTQECHLMQVKNAEAQLSYIAQYVDEIRTNQQKLLDSLYELKDNIKPRTQYGLIHGELGSDHILVNDKMEPYLIDIEGVMLFDIEHEHSFLELRFGEYYRYLKSDALDPDRLQFYRLHHHISLTSGGLKLLHRGFPDQEFAKGLAEFHSMRALRFIKMS